MLRAASGPAAAAGARQARGAAAAASASGAANGDDPLLTNPLGSTMSEAMFIPNGTSPSEIDDWKKVGGWRTCVCVLWLVASAELIPVEHLLLLWMPACEHVAVCSMAACACLLA